MKQVKHIDKESLLINKLLSYLFISSLLLINSIICLKM